MDVRAGIGALRTAGSRGATPPTPWLAGIDGSTLNESSERSMRCVLGAASGFLLSLGTPRSLRMSSMLYLAMGPLEKRGAVGSLAARLLRRRLAALGRAAPAAHHGLAHVERVRATVGDEIHAPVVDLRHQEHIIDD